MCQLLEAALAHHNLASYDEAIKFLAAARAALVEVTKASLVAERRKQALAMASKAEITAASLKAAAEFGSSQPLSSSDTPTAEVNVRAIPAVAPDISSINAASISDDEVHVSFDLDMYITVCSGNVYQSSGDDEQALHRYISGWNRARAIDPESEWAMVFLNSIGAIAYYTLRYELGFHCFSTVAAYRSKVIRLRAFAYEVCI